MFKNILGVFNKICYINFFVIKEDRERMSSSLPPESRTCKILAAKNGEEKYLDEITSWVADELANEQMLIIPFPSTNIERDCAGQLSFKVVRRLSKISKLWEDGSGVIFRIHALPKNTRDEHSQYQSLGVVKERLSNCQNILIFDDVVTSGSSLMAALRIVSESSAKARVAALAIAKKVYLKEVPLSGIF